MEEKTLRRGYRNAWILTLLAIGYIVLALLLATATNRPGAPVEWDMGGEAFVPASSPKAEGYYLPVTDPEWLEYGKEDAQ
jgi:hypothetical protein